MYSKVKSTGRAARPKDFKNATQPKIVENEQDTSPQRKRRKSANSQIKEKSQVKPPTKTVNKNKKQVTPPPNKRGPKGGKKAKNSVKAKAPAPPPKKKFQTKKPYVTSRPTTQRIRIIENESSSTLSDEEEDQTVETIEDDGDSDGHTESEVMKGDSETSYGSTVGEVMDEEVGIYAIQLIKVL